MAYPTDPATIAGIWTALALMFMVYSYPLWKENITYRFAEHTLIGVGFGISIVQAIRLIRDSAVIPLTQGTTHLIIPIILGIALYCQFFRSVRWISRYTISLLVGVGTGIAAVGVIQAQVIAQILGVIKPPVSPTPIAWFNYFFIGIGLICTASYFIFTREHTGVLYVPTKIGRYLIMLGLGAYFGNTVMFRETMLAGRVEYMLRVFKIIPW